MAGKQVAGDGFPANIAGMSKNQLYDIMSQMKALIEQNQQQARQILIQNPLLTKALFQAKDDKKSSRNNYIKAQIMLGMVQAPQMPQASQHPQQPIQQPLPAKVQPAQSFSGQVGSHDQSGLSQTQPSVRKQHLNQLIAPTSAPFSNIQSQSMPLHPLQPPQPTKGHLNPPLTHPQPSQMPNMPQSSLHSSSQPPLHQNQMSAASSQLQPPLQTAGISLMPLQPPLPAQPRPPVSTFHHQYPPQIAPNIGFQHPGAPQHHSQPVFHPGIKPPPAAVGPSYAQGQPQLASQPLNQSYQGQAGGLHFGTDFGSQAGSSMQVDRGPSWMPNQPENPTVPQFQGPPSFPPGQMGPGAQPARPASLTADMEKALLQQVMSLTPEQINLLPPEQRNQVLQLQQMLRQ